ncbi:MAG: PorT family protein [Duncaniella sp.]|nr:PorT family protein [Duncaniella sp.]MDE6466425.1 PorT family protein [Duncaniella sp.]
MRRILLILALLIPSALLAQREYSPKFYLGAKGGATLSRMTFSPGVHQKMVQGVTMGVSAKYVEENIFGLLAEVNVTQRGWKEDFERDLAPEFDYSRKLTYIQIPFMTHIYFGSDKFKGFINLGPEFGYMIGDKISANFEYNNLKDIPGFPTTMRTNEQMSMEIERKFDYGIAAGAGMEFIVKRKHSLQLEGRFYYGLGNIFNDSKRDFFSASRGMSIEITLGYMIRVK